MRASGTLRWLHRIGYATTLIVAFEIAVIGWSNRGAWRRISRIEAAQLEDTRTHIGPFIAGTGDPVRDDAVRLFAKLPPLASLGPDAVRYAIAPSFSRQYFAVALRPTKDGVTGVLVTVGGSDMDTLGTEKRRAFVMPIQAYQTLMTRADRLTDGWTGTTRFWNDGTAIAFERVHGGTISSGIGNGLAHYGKLTAAVRDGLAPYVPGVASLNGEWMQPRRGEAQ